MKRARLYEHRTEPLLPARLFLRRLVVHALAAAVLLAFSLGLGACGYRCTEGMPWLDALLNASMILAGMGPVDVLHTTAGKLFASAYALFSGIAFLVTAGALRLSCCATTARRMPRPLHTP